MHEIDSKGRRIEFVATLQTVSSIGSNGCGVLLAESCRICSQCDSNLVLSNFTLNSIRII